MSIMPLENRVLVKPTKEKAEMTPSGLYVPGTVEKNVASGTVISVGPGKMLATGVGLQNLPSELKAGDSVLFRRGTGLEVEGFLLLEEYEVLAKVN